MPLSASWRPPVLAFAGTVALVLGMSPTALADPPANPKPDPANSASNTAQSIDLTFFRNTRCNADQILDAMEKVSPALWAKIKGGPVGSRRQKWVRNWLIMVLESGQARPGMLDYNEINNTFGDWFWQDFQTNQADISAACEADIRSTGGKGPKGKKAPSFDPGYSSAIGG